MGKIKLQWFGRCCFLIEIGKKKILTDPYDTFDGVDIGIIESDYLISSSIAHDHGHVGASPKSYTIGGAGEYDFEGIKITGISSKESRGTSNTLFNIKVGKFSITNFADWGQERDIEKFSKNELIILNSTNVAFVRPNLAGEETTIQAAEITLRVCNPQIIIPHHFYPESFVRENPTENMLKGLRHYKPLVSRLIEKLDYDVRQINSYKIELTENDLKKKSVLLFSKLHPQVKYVYD